MSLSRYRCEARATKNRQGNTARTPEDIVDYLDQTTSPLADNASSNETAMHYQAALSAVRYRTPAHPPNLDPKFETITNTKITLGLAYKTYNCITNTFSDVQIWAGLGLLPNNFLAHPQKKDALSISCFTLSSLFFIWSAWTANQNKITKQYNPNEAIKKRLGEDSEAYRVYHYVDKVIERELRQLKIERQVNEKTIIDQMQEIRNELNNKAKLENLDRLANFTGKQESSAQALKQRLLKKLESLKHDYELIKEKHNAHKALQLFIPICKERYFRLCKNPDFDTALSMLAAKHPFNFVFTLEPELLATLDTQNSSITASTPKKKANIDSYGDLSSAIGSPFHAPSDTATSSASTSAYTTPPRGRKSVETNNSPSSSPVFRRHFAPVDKLKSIEPVLRSGVSGSGLSLALGAEEASKASQVSPPSSTNTSSSGLQALGATPSPLHFTSSGHASPTPGNFTFRELGPALPSLNTMTGPPATQGSYKDFMTGESPSMEESSTSLLHWVAWTTVGFIPYIEILIRGMESALSLLGVQITLVDSAGPAFTLLSALSFASVIAYARASINYLLKTDIAIDAFKQTFENIKKGHFRYPSHAATFAAALSCLYYFGEGYRFSFYSALELFSHLGGYTPEDLMEDPNWWLANIIISTIFGLSMATLTYCTQCQNTFVRYESEALEECFKKNQKLIEEIMAEQNPPDIEGGQVAMHLAGSLLEAEDCAQAAADLPPNKDSNSATTVAPDPEDITPQAFATWLKARYQHLSDAFSEDNVDNTYYAIANVGDSGNYAKNAFFVGVFICTSIALGVLATDTVAAFIAIGLFITALDFISTLGKQEKTFHKIYNMIVPVWAANLFRSAPLIFGVPVTLKECIVTREEGDANYQVSISTITRAGWCGHFRERSSSQQVHPAVNPTAEATEAVEVYRSCGRTPAAS
jgi:hypothetical protein